MKNKRDWIFKMSTLDKQIKLFKFFDSHSFFFFSDCYCNGVRTQAYIHHTTCSICKQFSTDWDWNRGKYKYVAIIAKPSIVANESRNKQTRSQTINCLISQYNYSSLSLSFYFFQFKVNTEQFICVPLTTDTICCCRCCRLHLCEYVFRYIKLLYWIEGLHRFSCIHSL